MSPAWMRRPRGKGSQMAPEDIVHLFRYGGVETTSEGWLRSAQGHSHALRIELGERVYWRYA